MARGWESKSVESQQSDREADTGQRSAVSPEHVARLARRRVLELARARAAADLELATRPSHRQMLESAIRDLDTQIRGVANPSDAGGAKP